jgi:hypothetical protein
MKKPTAKQLTDLKQRIEAAVVNKGPKTDTNAIAIVAAKHQRTKQSIRRMLWGQLANWKPHHFDIYNDLLKTVKSLNKV